LAFFPAPKRFSYFHIARRAACAPAGVGGYFDP